MIVYPLEGSPGSRLRDGSNDRRTCNSLGLRKLRPLFLTNNRGSQARICIESFDKPRHKELLGLRLNARRIGTPSRFSRRGRSRRWASQ